MKYVKREKQRERLERSSMNWRKRDIAPEAYVPVDSKTPMTKHAFCDTNFNDESYHPSSMNNPKPHPED